MKSNHFDGAGNAIMVDVSEKASTKRVAIAEGHITMNAQAFEAVQAGTAKKGDVLGTARIAGIMGSKRCSDLIPLCHPLPTEQVSIDFTLLEKERSVTARCTVTTTGKTGVEMEALCGANIALLTIYDMCKALDRSLEIGGISLLEKQGGKSGHYKKEP
ncbi:cyclic pyranopterin monophosphate synthase MoaC [Ruminococcaceae bacterium OttesenSCG-928-A11]|nr:cyclic pyranopterin monophosphate synthase MoaC [Ruminococcaceae bacterium OttesenSCG-928-A11]